MTASAAKPRLPSIHAPEWTACSGGEFTHALANLVDTEAEASLLSWLLEPPLTDVGREDAHTAIAMLRPEHFFSDRNRAVFSAISAMHAAGTPVTLTAVGRHMSASWDRIGGALGLAQLHDLPELAPALDLARLVRELYTARETYGALRDALYRVGIGEDVPGVLRELATQTKRARL